MYVCMYVCMYVRTYVCMYACMYVYMYVRMYVCMHVAYRYTTVACVGQLYVPADCSRGSTEARCKERVSEMPFLNTVSP